MDGTNMHSMFNRMAELNSFCPLDQGQVKLQRYFRKTSLPLPVGYRHLHYLVRGRNQNYLVRFRKRSQLGIQCNLFNHYGEILLLPSCF